MDGSATEAQGAVQGQTKRRMGVITVAESSDDDVRRDSESSSGVLGSMECNFIWWSVPAASEYSMY